MRSLIGRARIGAGSVLVALAAVMAVPGLAAADTELGASGDIGAHSLRDSVA